MSYTHSRVGSKDMNHDLLADLYRALGCSVFEVNSVPGFVDLIVGAVGKTCLVEIKTEDGELTGKQKVFHRDWRGGRPVTVRTEGDVVNHVTQMRRG